MQRAFQLLKIGMVLFGAVVAMPTLASAQSGASATADDPNDKSAHDRTFEETRKHMQAHSEWSKKTGKMSDN